MRKFVVTVAAATVFLAGAPIMGLNAARWSRRERSAQQPIA